MNADGEEHPGYYLEEHRPDKAEVRGSNPCPWTKKFIVKFREPLGLPECPYVIRWRVETPFGSIRLHHWLAPDDDRAKHDHPWWFGTLVFKGGYTDSSPFEPRECSRCCNEISDPIDTHCNVCGAALTKQRGGPDHLRAPAIRFRRATHQHTVFPDPDGAWTVMVTGPKTRAWGFWVKGKFIKMNKYFFKFGHHPCS